MLPVTPEQKIEIVKTHYTVIATVLGSEEKAVDFLAWSAKFFNENPNILKEISNPKTRDKVFKTAISFIDNPLFKSMF